MQVVYDAATRTVARRLVRVWDAQPERNLDFSWEPAAGSFARIAPDGTVSGEGLLTWRVRGAASYDARAVFATYRGRLENGRPDGEGRLVLRSGEILDGFWKAGVLDGEGSQSFADGSRYEGPFHAGLAEGEGRLNLPSGEIYRGSFHAGLREGSGETRLPGGTVYRSHWTAGVEEAGVRPSGVADALAGGLVLAQKGGSGDAANVEIGVSVEQRVNQQAEVRYTEYTDDNAIQIYPEDENTNEYWNGTAEVGFQVGTFSGIDWENAKAFVSVKLEAKGGKRMKLDGVELAVQSSEAYRKPMMTVEEHVGCVGFRPTFSIMNHGWGNPKDVKLSVHFQPDVPFDASDESTEPKEPAFKTRDFTVDVGSFADGIDVSIADVLRQAGVDTAKLENERFRCASTDELPACRQKIKDDVAFGELGDALSGEDAFYTNMAGTISYTWADDKGETYEASEPIRGIIDLVKIELPPAAAEYGDGFNEPPETMRFQDVRLPVNKENYAVPLAIRGSRAVPRYEARLKMSAEMSSFHQFRVKARFADGSERQSKLVQLFYFRPKPSTFESKTRPASCYLQDEMGDGN